MGHRALSSRVFEARPLSVAELAAHGASWLLDGEIRRLSPATLAFRRLLLDKLLWHLRQQEAAACGVPELRAFLAYLNTGHAAAGGRWGNPQLTSPVKPGTTKTYFISLKTLFAWLVEEGALEDSPMEALRAPIARADQIQPFSREQEAALIAAARASWHPRRNEAILLLLLDTGMRVSELCGLRREHLDLPGRRCVVTGKGGKERALWFGRRTTRALWAHLGHAGTADGALFTAQRGPGAHRAMTRRGVLHLFEELGKAARIEAVRCSPHTARHTWAINFLRSGGDVFALQALLGHTSLAICQRYLALAQADLEEQARRFSPVDRLGAR